MSIAKQFILQCDLFAHNSLQRYKQQEGYRTLIGGIVSIILVILFFIVFFTLVVNTFSMNIINAQVSTEYEHDPTYSELFADPSKNYMFAIGITGVDLSSSERYFDILLTNRTYTKNGSSLVKDTTTIPLSPCQIKQWSGVAQGITDSFTVQNFSQWLCPPLGTVFPLQGKFTSNIFKFAQLSVSTCTDNSLYPNTTCRTDIDTFTANQGQFTINIYVINPVINSGDQNFISYYLEDSNYFSFDTYTGTSANLFYNDYKIITDTSIMPWVENSQVSGLQMVSTAVGRIFQVSNNKNQYFKFYWRKASGKVKINRSFQKLDQTLSYIGGLFGTITLLLIFLKLYSKYAYELDVADKFFKENNGGTFGSENFNFIVFLGYAVFVMFTKFGIILNWKTMKKYHRCRQECQRQLNIDLWLKKLSYFEQISEIVLEDHHLKMLLMVPKPTIKEAKLNRKKYLTKSIIYHQLERKGKDYAIQQQEFRQRYLHFLKGQSGQRQRNQDEILNNQSTMKLINEEFFSCYKKTQSQNQSQHSKKIMRRLNSQQMVKTLMQFISLGSFQEDSKVARPNIRLALNLQLLPIPSNLSNEQSRLQNNGNRQVDSSKIMVAVSNSEEKI